MSLGSKLKRHYEYSAIIVARCRQRNPLSQIQLTQSGLRAWLRLRAATAQVQRRKRTLEGNIVVCDYIGSIMFSDFQHFYLLLEFLASE